LLSLLLRKINDEDEDDNDDELEEEDVMMLPLVLLLLLVSHYIPFHCSCLRASLFIMPPGQRRAAVTLRPTAIAAAANHYLA
jgi:hypothetical protein